MFTLKDIVYHNRNFFIPKIIVVFRTDLNKMKINTKLCCKRYNFLKKKKDPKLSLSELLSRITRIQIYSYDLLCEPVLSMHSLETINNMWFLGKRECQRFGRKQTLMDSERKMNRSAVSSKWNKCRIYVEDQLDRWNELKEVLRVQTRAEVAKILLDR